MSLTKEYLIDKVEFVGEWKVIQVRNKTVIKDNGVVVSESFDRDSYYPGDELPEDLQPYANGVWTETLISEYAAHLQALQESTQYPEPAQ
jgi:hypothetical protein